MRNAENCPIHPAISNPLNRLPVPRIPWDSLGRCPFFFSCFVHFVDRNFGESTPCMLRAFPWNFRTLKGVAKF
jgi:hypothetical protein